MTEVESFENLYERVLLFSGAFASAEASMDDAVRLYIRHQLPTLGMALIADKADSDRGVLAQISDKQHSRLFRALVPEVGYDVNASMLGQVYERARQTRNLVAHSPSIVGPVYRTDGPPAVGVGRFRGTNTKMVPRLLYPSTFDRLRADCEWILAHALRITFETGGSLFIDAAGEAAEPPRPAARPVGGEPLP